MNSNLPTKPVRDGATYDVVVVGGRAAGAATAMLLARGGLRTALLERGTFGSDTLSTHALMRAGVLQLSRWGLLDTIVSAGTPPIRRTTFRYGDEHVVIGIKPAHGVDALYAPRRTLLDSTLVRAAMADGVEVYDHTAVVDVLRRGERVIGVRAMTDDRQPVDVRAPLVIGADGIRSVVAASVGAPTIRRGRHSGAATYGYWSELPTDGYEWVFRADACSGVIPTNGGEACVFASSSPARIGRGGIDAIIETASLGSPELGERLRAARPPRGTRTWPGQPGYLRRAFGTGWALVGDAGYFKDPISAHGLSDALRDAELLARAVLAGDSDTERLDSLRDYEETRNRLSVPLFDVVDRIASQQWSDVEIADLLLRLSASMHDEVETLAALDGDLVP